MIIIPDVHGRKFWKQVVTNLNNGEEMIFLGDYLDPYSWEGISRRQAIETLHEVIALKQAYPQLVTLLLGNHDMMTYISEDMGYCRTDFDNKEEIRAIYRKFHDFFEMATIRTVNGQKYVFSHAGILANWASDPRVQPVLGCESDDIDGIVEALNLLWHEHDPRLFKILDHVSHYRGGQQATGSPVWADVNEWDDQNPDYEGVYQVFGHSQQTSRPLLFLSFACLDCRKAFRLNEDGFTLLG